MRVKIMLSTLSILLLYACASSIDEKVITKEIEEVKRQISNGNYSIAIQYYYRIDKNSSQKVTLEKLKSSLDSLKNDDEEKSTTEALNLSAPSLDKENEAFNEFKLLYAELIRFKSKSDFKKYGLSINGPYNKWHERQKRLVNHIAAKQILLKKKVAFGDLYTLAIEYMHTGGKETKLSRYLNNQFKNSLEIDAPIEGSAKYNEIKNNYELLGKWKMMNGFSKPHIMKVYHKLNKWVAVHIDDYEFIEQLRKDGNYYYILGDASGEGYYIDKNKKLIQFDKEGELTSLGYKSVLTP